MAVVTVSRGPGTEGHLLAEGLARRLDYELVTREEVVQAAARHGVPPEKVQEALLEAPSFWDLLKLDRTRYVTFVQAALSERAQQDRIVYEGNAGHLLLRGISHVVCIRLLAPMSRRIQVAMERLSLDHDEAVRYVEHADHQRESWTRHLYGVDWLDPTLYDLTLNLRTLQLSGAIEAALKVVEQPEFEPTPESRAAMANLVLQSRVQAALAADERTAAAQVTVHAENGVVSLRGRVRPARVVEIIISVASQVEGVREVNRQDLDAPEYTV